MTLLMGGLALMVAPSPWAALVLVAALVMPEVSLLVVFVVSLSDWRATLRRPDVPPLIANVVELAGELRAGSTLRSVVGEGVLGPVLAVRATAGLPLMPSEPETIDLGPDGRLIATTLELAAGGGGAIAAMMERLAAGMMERERIRRERRAAMAPAITQAAVVGGAPALMLIWMLLDGRLLALVSSGPIGAGLAVFGTVTVVAGVTWIGLMVRRTK